MLNKQTEDESQDSMTNAPIRRTTAHEDQDAEAQAAEARRRGTELIEDHLSSHLTNNPDSDYVTWIATLHPENAHVQIDHRFFVPGNPWWTVYESAPAPGKGNNHNNGESIPTATAVPVAAPEDPPKSSFPDTLESKEDGTVVAAPSSRVCSPIDFLVGSVISLSAIVTVYGIELSALLIYSLSACFYKTAQSMAPPSFATSLFYVVLLLVYWSLALIDSCLLLASVLTTELMAITAWIISSLFAGCETAGKWHQYIRRTCHLARGSFRPSKAYPPRVFCGLCGVKKDNAEEEEEGKSPKTYSSSPGAAAASPPPVVPTLPSAPPSRDDEDVVMIPDENLIVEDNVHKKDDTFTQVYW